MVISRECEKPPERSESAYFLYFEHACNILQSYTDLTPIRKTGASTSSSNSLIFLTWSCGVNKIAGNDRNKLGCRDALYSLCKYEQYVGLCVHVFFLCLCEGFDFKFQQLPTVAPCTAERSRLRANVGLLNRCIWTQRRLRRSKRCKERRVGGVECKIRKPLTSWSGLHVSDTF